MCARCQVHAWVHACGMPWQDVPPDARVPLSAMLQHWNDPSPFQQGSPVTASLLRPTAHTPSGTVLPSNTAHLCQQFNSPIKCCEGVCGVVCDLGLVDPPNAH